MPPSMPLRKNRSKRKKRRSSTHTDWKTDLCRPTLYWKWYTPAKPTVWRLKVSGPDFRYPCYICEYYMILWEDGPYLYPPDLIVLQAELSLKGLDTNATTRTDLVSPVSINLGTIQWMVSESYNRPRTHFIPIVRKRYCAYDMLSERLMYKFFVTIM